MSEVSTKPYLVRAIYEWCTDNGYTPYLAVSVDEKTTVPTEHVKDDQIVLNIAATATQGLLIKNSWVEFQARFNGIARSIFIPVERITAVYARENGHGMAFEVTPYSKSSKEPPTPTKNDSSGRLGERTQSTGSASSKKNPPRLVSLSTTGSPKAAEGDEVKQKTEALEEDSKDSVESTKEKKEKSKKDSKKTSSKKKSHLTRIK